jgi:hypothetical protein
MEHELRRAAQAFFRQTRAWKVDQALKAVVADTDVVAVAPDSTDQELVRVEAAWWDGRAMSPVTPEAVDRQFVQEWQTHTGTPEHYMELAPGELRIYPVPLADAAEGLRLRLSVAPSDDATGLPDDIALRYRDEIHVGAKARLMLMPGKSWSSPDLAAVYGQAFSGMVAKATMRAARAGVGARIPSSPKWC